MRQQNAGNLLLIAGSLVTVAAARAIDSSWIPLSIVWPAVVAAALGWRVASPAAARDRERCASRRADRRSRCSGDRAHEDSRLRSCSTARGCRARAARLASESRATNPSDSSRHARPEATGDRQRDVRRNRRSHAGHVCRRAPGMARRRRRTPQPGLHAADRVARAGAGIRPATPARRRARRQTLAHDSRQRRCRASPRRSRSR